MVLNTKNKYKYFPLINFTSRSKNEINIIKIFNKKMSSLYILTPKNNKNAKLYGILFTSKPKDILNNFEIKFSLDHAWAYDICKNVGEYFKVIHENYNDICWLNENYDNIITQINNEIKKFDDYFSYLAYYDTVREIEKIICDIPLLFSTNERTNETKEIKTTTFSKKTIYKLLCNK